MKRCFLLPLALLAATHMTAQAEDSLDQLITKAAQTVKRETGADPSLPVKLRTNRTVYRAGDKVQTFVTVPANSHVRLYHRNANGEVTVVFPNRLVPDSLVRGGAEMPMPGPDDEWEIAIEAKPAGREFLALVVSDRPFADAAELAAAIARDEGPARMGNLRIEEVIGKGLRALPMDAQSTPPSPKPPDGKIGIAMLEITTSATSARNPHDLN